MRGESQGSLLNSASTLDSILSLAKQSLDFSDSGFMSPDQFLLLNELSQFVTNLT